MLTFAIVTAFTLLLALLVVMFNAYLHTRQYPQGTALDGLAQPGYDKCRQTLALITERFHAIKNGPVPLIAWYAPDRCIYTISMQGVQQRREISTNEDVYFIPWDTIGGIGMRMQPNFSSIRNPDGSRSVTHYSFHFLIVPHSGSTIDITFPTDGREDAIDFAARTLAVAEQMRKRVNLFGFDKPPTSVARKGAYRG
jgi:hypothetical protein